MEMNKQMYESRITNDVRCRFRATIDIQHSSFVIRHFNMLCRVANSLYWMSRYIERAENIARIVDVNLQLLLDFRNLDEERLARPLDAHRAGHRRRGGVFSSCISAPPARPSRSSWCSSRRIPTPSFHSICQARENARMVRDQITR